MAKLREKLLIVWRVCLGLIIQPSTAKSIVRQRFKRFCLGCGCLTRARMQKNIHKYTANKISRTDKKPSTPSTPSTLIIITIKKQLVRLFIVSTTTLHKPSTGEQ
jgi:hypothetical protein